MQPPTPAISVLVPTYNYGRYLHQTIESVLRQDFGDYELIISDDCSTDNTAKVLSSYASRDSRLRIQTHRSNLGMVANWNWCLHEARGRYVKYLFGDDALAHPSALSRLKDLLDKNPDVSLAASARLTLDATSTVTGIWDDIGRAGVSTGPSMARRCFRSSLNLPGEPSAVIFRRTQALRGFDPALRQIVDLEMWFYLLNQGAFAYTPEPLCCFRIHGQQQTAVNRENHVGVLEMAALLDRYLSLFAADPQDPLSESDKAAIRYRALHHLRKKNSGRPAFATAIQALESQIPIPVRAVSALEYRLFRPLENIRRSLRRRNLRSRLRNGTREQLAFLSSLPTVATAH